jgi:DNA-directed RNA polymerase specialized sigma24 family protein
MSRTSPLRGEAAPVEREEFDRALAPHFRELLQAAQREVRHRLALGQFEPDRPTPEELLDVALQNAWRNRGRLPPGLGIQAWALISILRTGEALGVRKAERGRRITELLPEDVEPDPLYQDDEEDFWQLHELDYPRDEHVFSSTADCPPEDVANDDELVGRLAPREREALLMHELHGVPLQEVALALRISPNEANRLLENAQRRVRSTGKVTE